MPFEALVIRGFPLGEEPGTFVTMGSGIPMQPGDSTDLALGVLDYEVCGTGVRCFVPVDVNATWSLVPAGADHIDPTSGVLSIDAGTPSGSELTARAEVDGGQAIVETEVTVYTPEANPLIGFWREEAQRPCDNGPEIVPAQAIEELIFYANGNFSVTWVPFESYQDYWGTYVLDRTRGTLELVIAGGNSIPSDANPEGRFALDATGQLILTELWLGNPISPGGETHCGHRFVR